MSIEVSHVDSPNSFWAQYDEREYHNMLGGVEHEVCRQLRACFDIWAYPALDIRL